MSYVRESDIRVKSYDHSNILSASVVHFRASQYIMSPNSDIRVKSYDHSNSRELPLFNFECLDELCARIGHSCEKL